MRCLFCALAVVAVVMGDGPVVAHHSYGGYEMTRIVEIQGALEDIEWAAPHTLLKVRADDGRLYTAEWRAPAALQRVGVARDTLKQGERIVVTGNPRRDFDQSSVMNFKSVRRPSDGWQWPAQP